MRATLAIVALAASAMMARAEIEEEEDVLVLTDDNFDEAIKAHDPLLVEFYAPWCGHCKSLAPEYAKAATELLENDPPLRIAKVDATANDKLAQKFKIQGFPTLKFFKGGNPTEYNGGRKSADIVSWVQRKSGPAYTVLETTEDATAFKAKDDAVVVGFFSALEGDSFDAFAAAAGRLDDAPCAVSTSADVRKSLGVEGTDDAVVVLTSFADGVTAFDGDATDADAIAEFALVQRLPLVTTFSSETAPKIFGGPVKTHVLIMASDDGEGFEDLKASWATEAKATRGKALYIWVPPSEDRILSYFDVTEADLPTAVVVNMPDDSAMKKYPFEGDVKDAAALGAFVGSVLAGDVQPTLKSEEPEAADTEGPVVVVRGKSFKDIVVDSDDDVLLEFYAPWCGHCKALAPEYEKLAIQLSGSKNLVIAKIDATANEVEYDGVNVRGFPTLFFFPASTDGSPKQAVEFSGDRTVEGFISYIKEHATHPVVEGEGEAEAEEKDEL